MRRSLHVAAAILASGALASACLLDAGPLPTSGSGGSGATGGSGGTGASTLACGNGVLEEGEGCDDGDSDGENGCNLNCAINPGWACVNELGKKSVCQKTCGDGDVDSGEKCDDANLDADDGCSPSCTVEIGYKCDDTKPPAEQCYLACGDGIFDSAEPFAEECDLGDNDPMKGCSTDCKVIEGWICGGGTMCEPFCGDGIIVGEEPCDDQNSNGGDGCSINCETESGWTCTNNVCTPNCGDGLIKGNEPCDDGNTSAGDGCNAACALEATCGNNKVEPGEECDEGAAGNNDCDSSCKLIAPSGTCSNLPDINAQGTSMMNAGAKITTFKGDTSVNPVTSFADPTKYGDPACTADISQSVKVHKYKTGNYPSMIIIETVDDGPTFDETVVWVALDCLSPKIDACDDNNGGSSYSLLNVGYVPAQTTLFVAVADNAAPTTPGPYTLKITEQPVRLFHYNPLDQFNALTPEPAGMDEATWKHCAMSNSCSGGGNPGNNPTFSRSGGGFALASDNPNKTVIDKTMRTALFDTLAAPTKVFVQYNFFFKHDSDPEVDKFSAGVTSDPVSLPPLPWSESVGDAGGRRVQDATSLITGSKVGLGFEYTDANSDAEYSAVDDIYVFGY